jgi:integrase
VVGQFNKLSARAVETLVEPKRHGDGGGLWLSVSPSGRRRWVFMFRWRGKLTEMGLGSARKGARGYVSLKSARERAEAARLLLRDGTNPLTAKRQKPADVPTFGVFADGLINDLASGFSNEKHVEQWRMTIEKKAAAIRNKPINEITTEDVLSVIKPLWTTRPETASRLRGRIERVLSAAKAQGLRDGENPARWRGHLDQRLPKRQKLSRGHHAALPFDDVPAFMVKLRAREAPAARALEFLILSATRGAETRGAVWSEFDLDAGVWTIPAVRMKSKRDHRVPISARMRVILTSAKIGKPEDFVFPGPKPKQSLSEGAFKVLLDRMDFGAWTPHGFRSSFRDWCAERTAFPQEVAEMALAHVIKDQTEAAYRRGDLFDKRRKLMEAWAGFCAAPKNGKVVSINRDVATP